MTKEQEKVYDMILEDWINGDIYAPHILVKRLIMFLEPEALEKFEQMYLGDDL